MRSLSKTIIFQNLAFFIVVCVVLFPYSTKASGIRFNLKRMKTSKSFHNQIHVSHSEVLGDTEPIRISLNETNSAQNETLSYPEPERASFNIPKVETVQANTQNQSLPSSESEKIILDEPRVVTVEENATNQSLSSPESEKTDLGEPKEATFEQKTFDESISSAQPERTILGVPQEVTIEETTSDQSQSNPEQERTIIPAPQSVTVEEENLDESVPSFQPETDGPRVETVEENTSSESLSNSEPEGTILDAPRTDSIEEKKPIDSEYHLSLYNEKNTYMYIEVTVGSEIEPRRLILDSYFSSTWMPNPKSEIIKEATDGNRKPFDCEASVTCDYSGDFTEDIDINLKNGKLKGRIAKDIFKFGVNGSLAVQMDFLDAKEMRSRLCLISNRIWKTGI